MELFPEIVLLSTGFIGIIANILTLFAILISKRRTPTHIYIMYAALLKILEQFASPAFHHLYTLDFFKQFDGKLIINSVFLMLVFGKITWIIFFFLMDYFNWISTYKWIVITAHFSTLLLINVICFVIGEIYLEPNIMDYVIAITFLGFMLLYLVHRELECLEKRKGTDDESRLRYILILAYTCTNIIEFVILVIEYSLAYMSTGEYPICLTIGLYQIDSVFALIVLFKVDCVFKMNFIELFKMCSWVHGRKPRHQNLSCDNGQLLGQDA